MLLTGKAKDYFFSYINREAFYSKNIEYKFGNLPESCKNALIIEWFDSVNIYIDCAPLFLYDETIFACLVNDEMVSSVQYKTRSEATQQAIIKANEIYNNLNK